MLDILAAGDASALACARQLLDAIGKKTWPLGDEPHKVKVAQIAAKLMLASALETMAHPHCMMAALTRSNLCPRLPEPPV